MRIPLLRNLTLGLVLVTYGAVCSWPKVAKDSVVSNSAHRAAQKHKSASNAGPLQQTAIRARVRQVLLDVVVTKDRQPVAGLKEKDFAVYEDGKLQQILSFKDSKKENSAYSELSTTPTDRSPQTFTNAPLPADDLPINMLLYDALNTHLTDLPFARNAVLRFFRHKPADSRFAIFVLGNKLHLIQGLTDDREQLIEAMNHGASNLAPSLAPGENTTLTASESFNQSGLTIPPGTEHMIEGLQQMEAADALYGYERRMLVTIDAFKEISRFLSGVPGRKNLLWLASDFPFTVSPTSDPLNAFPAAAPYSRQFREAASQLILSQIAIYPVDIAGLETDPAFSAANPRNYRTPAEFSQAHQSFIQGLFGKEMMMEEIAEESGGRAFYNTNGLADAVATAVREGATHYTLSYSPSNENFDGGVRKILVRLKQKGFSLSYRRRYLALDSPEVDSVDRLELAMGRGAPLVRDLVFELRVSASGAPTAASPVQRRTLSEFEPFSTSQLRDKTLLQRYSLQIMTDPLSGAVTPGGGRRASGNMEMGIDAYDSENRLVWRERHLLTVESEEAGRRGSRLQFTQPVEIPSTTAWLRIGLQDINAGRIGSLEVPLSGNALMAK